ncbi:unnamed protein product [Sympodiomycopsis kandeliae]
MSSSSDNDQVLLLSGSVISQILDEIPLERLLSSQREAFETFSRDGEDNASKARQGWEAPLRSSVSTSNHTHLFMPGRIQESVSIKCVAVPFSNRPDIPPGLPGTGLVFDEKSAKVKAILNQSKLTAVRTAIGCLLASQYIIPQGEQERMKKILVFGTGAQALWHARVFVSHYTNVDQVHFVGNSGKETSKGQNIVKDAEQLFTRKVDISLSTYQDEDVLYEKLSEADLIFGCTPSVKSHFDWEKYHTLRRSAAGTAAGQRQHFTLIGSYRPHMQEVATELIQQASNDGQLFVDSKSYCSKEAGDLIKADVDQSKCIEIGKALLQQDDKDTKAGRVVGSELPISVFKSVGVALQDVCITKLIVQEAQRMGLGQLVDF